MQVYFVERGAQRPPVILHARDEAHARGLADARKGLAVRRVQLGDTVKIAGGGFGRIARDPELSSVLFVQEWDHVAQSFRDEVVPVRSADVFQVCEPVSAGVH